MSKWIKAYLKASELSLIVVYAFILAIFLLLFWLTTSTAVYTDKQQISSLSSDLIVVFGVLLGLTPLIKRKLTQFYTAIVASVGILISLMAKIVAETTTQTTPENLSRMTTLLNGAFTVFIILIAVYPVLFLLYGDEARSPQKTEK